MVQQRALVRLAPSIEESTSESEEKVEKVSEDDDDDQRAAAPPVENYGGKFHTFRDDPRVASHT